MGKFVSILLADSMDSIGKKDYLASSLQVLAILWLQSVSFGVKKTLLIECLVQGDVNKQTSICGND